MSPIIEGKKPANIPLTNISIPPKKDKANPAFAPFVSPPGDFGDDGTNP